MKRWKCPSCRRRAGVPVLYGLPSLAAVDAAGRGALVFGGCVLTDDDPPRCCTHCRAALWPGGVFAVPGAADDMRIVLHRRPTGRRLEGSVGEDGTLGLAWTGSGGPEPAAFLPGDDNEVLLVAMAVEVLGDCVRMSRWLERRGLAHVGTVAGPVERFSFGEDGMLAVGGPGGDLLLHGSVPRLLLHLVAALFGRQGHRTIGEFREWVEAVGLDLVGVDGGVCPPGRAARRRRSGPMAPPRRLSS